MDTEKVNISFKSNVVNVKDFFLFDWQLFLSVKGLHSVQQKDLNDLCSSLPHQLDWSTHGSSRGEYIVNQDDFISLLDTRSTH